MRLVHNRCVFTDKQIVRLQEAPEHRPEGTRHRRRSRCARRRSPTPPSREIASRSGVYRTQALRVNPRNRTMRSIYKTYVDIVHVRKLDKGKRAQAQPREGEGFAALPDSVDNAGASTQAERVAGHAWPLRRRRRSTRPDLRRRRRSGSSTTSKRRAPAPASLAPQPIARARARARPLRGRIRRTPPPASAPPSRPLPRARRTSLPPTHRVRSGEGSSSVRPRRSASRRRNRGSSRVVKVN